MKKLKEIDFKSYLLEKGERVGLIVAAVLTALFVSGTAYTALNSGTAKEKAEAISKVADTVEKQLNDRTRQPGPADLPPADAMAKLSDNVRWDPVSSKSYVMGNLHDSITPGLGGRRLPQILNIEEAAAEVGRMQVRAYYLINNDKGTQIVCLKGEGLTPTAGGGAGETPGKGAGTRSHRYDPGDVRAGRPWRARDARRRHARHQHPSWHAAWHDGWGRRSGEGP